MTAAERLEASRAKLREALAPPAPPPRRAASPPSASSWSAWKERLRAHPSTAHVMEALHTWWARHPIRPVAESIGVASDRAIRPIAEQHPIVVVLSAAAVGALIGKLKPWRLLFRSALVAGLAPKLAARFLFKLPAQSWMNLASAAFRTGAPRRTSQAARQPPTGERPMEKAAA